MENEKLQELRAYVTKRRKDFANDRYPGRSNDPEDILAAKVRADECLITIRAIDRLLGGHSVSGCAEVENLLETQLSVEQETRK